MAMAVHFTQTHSKYSKVSMVTPGISKTIPNNILLTGSDSTPPPVSKMSPIANKFEGIPQEQRYINMFNILITKHECQHDLFDDNQV